MAEPQHFTRRDVERFVPTFCPHEECAHHELKPGDGVRYRFQRRGTRATRRQPGIVRRFTCNECGRNFSSSTFFLLYRRHRADVLGRAFKQLCEGSSARQTARVQELGVREVQGMIPLMAGQALLFSLTQLAQLRGRLEVPIILDGLRTFAGSQFEPGDLNTAIAGDTLFWLDIDYVGLVRGGTMTPAQKVKAAEREKVMGRPPKGVATRTCKQAIRRLRELLPPGWPLRLLTDEDKPTARAVASLSGEMTITHETISSRADREAPGHILWPVNHEHRLIRHSSKNHTRETLGFAKTTAGLVARAMIYRVYRNNIKGISERRGKELRETTPAMLLGLTTRPLRPEEIFHVRLFPRRVGLPRELQRHYDGTLKSRPCEVARIPRETAKASA